MGADQSRRHTHLDTGECCDACSRVTFPTFALAPEMDRATFPSLEEFNFNDCASFYPPPAATILAFIRLVAKIEG